MVGRSTICGAAVFLHGTGLPGASKALIDILSDLTDFVQGADNGQSVTMGGIMKISRISIYQVDLPMKEGAYSWATQSYAAFDSTVVAIETDEGLIGYGETCPLGPSYLPAFAEGARAAIAKMAPDLIGQDPTELDCINDRMDQLLKGHPYAKSAVDMACWTCSARQPDCRSMRCLAASVRTR